MGPFILFLFILALVFLMIAIHETGHYVAGWLCGLPAGDMKLVLFKFPQHVALRDGDEWVSPVRDIGRYIDVSRRHLRSRFAAFCWVAGGMAFELAFVAAVWGLALASGYRSVAFVVACVSLGMYAINVGIMDLPWALRYRCPAGDTSGLWQISAAAALIYSALMVTGRALLVAYSA
jgi:hypothetical protein